MTPRCPRCGAPALPEVGYDCGALDPRKLERLVRLLERMPRSERSDPDDLPPLI